MRTAPHPSPHRTSPLMHRKYRLPAVGVVTVAMLADPASGAVLRVPLDHATIGSALAAATAGDEVRVSDQGSPYGEHVVVPDGIRLIGGWDHPDYTASNPAARPTIIELPADSTGTVLGFGAAGPTTLLQGFTIRGGDTFSGGGIFCGPGCAAVIKNCIIRDNHATTGAGVQVASGSSVRIEDCRFIANRAIARGGGLNIALGADDVVIAHCTFEACSSAVNAQGNQGGGAVATASGIRFERNTVRDNWSGSNGGGLYVVQANIRAWGNLFYDNTAQTLDGGGIYHLEGSGTHDDTLVEGCSAGRNGGGVHFDGGASTFVHGFLHFNTAPAGLGGGIHFSQPMSGSRVEGTEIAGNRANAGGGVGVSGTTRASFVDIVSNTIVANIATGTDGTTLFGAGIHVTGQLVSNPSGGILNNIVALQTAGSGIYCAGVEASPLIRYSCVYNDPTANPAPAYAGLCTDRCGISGNICVDPRLCCNIACAAINPPAPDLELQPCPQGVQPPCPVSPCRGTGEGGVDMGAHDASVTCATPVSVESSSWGNIKSRYR